MIWTEEKRSQLIENYPEKGKKWCAENLGLTEGQVRSKASRLGLKQNKESDFFQDWQSRARNSKIGKKRPCQAEVIKRLHIEGKLIKTDEQRKAISIRVKEWIKENGHPKGALGMKHTDEALEKMSKSTKNMWKNMSQEKRDEYSKRASINGRNTSPINREGASWKAGWRDIGGYRKYYRSRWEANYARYLEFLKEHGEIQEWHHEPTTFWFDGIKRGCMSYLPDFEVIEKNGDVVYHEIKGWMDDRSKTKIKRMAKYHPDVKLFVIDAKSYRVLEKKAKEFVSGWE